MAVVELKLKRLVLWGAAALAGLAVLFLITLAWLYFSFPAAWLSSKISKNFEQNYHWKLTLPPISPFPLGHFFLGEVRLDDPNGRPFLKVKQLDIRYRLLPLLRGIVAVDRVAVDQPELFLRKENGEWNLLLLHKTLVPVPSPPGPLSKVDYFRTPLEKLWPKIEKALAETMKGMPGLRLFEVSIQNFRLAVDDGAGNLLELPPIFLSGNFLFTPSEKHSELHASVPKNSLLRINRNEFRMDLEKEAAWPGDRTASGYGKMRVSGKNNEKLLTAEAKWAADLASGDLAYELQEFSIPGYLFSRGLFKLEKFGLQRFEIAGELRTFTKAFSPTWASFLSNQFSIRKLPEISATVETQGKLSAPSLAELQRSLSKLSLPLHVDLHAKWTAKNLSPPLLPSGVSVRDIDGRLSLSAGAERVDLNSSLRISKMSLPPATTGGTDFGAFDLLERGKIAIEGLRWISIPEFAFELPTFGLKAEAKGNLSSTLPFPALAEIWKGDAKKFQKIREAVTTDLAASLAVDAAKVPKILKGLSIAGKIAGLLKLKKAKADRVDLALEGHGEAFSASTSDGAAVENLSFHFPLKKTLFLGPTANEKSRTPDASLWAKSYSEHLYSLSPYSNSLRIDRVAAQGHEVRNLVLDAGFDGSNLVVERFAANLLGGSIWGRMTFLPSGENLKLTAATEGVDLDMSKLTNEKFEGNARISLDAQSDLTLVPGHSLSPEGLLDDLSVQFHVTQVGEKTLDRLITFLDPKGENPSMVQARGLLRNKTVVSALRNPRVSFSVAHGMMDADIVLPGVKLVDLTIPIRGISVKNLLKFSGFRRSLANLAPALEAAKYLRLAGIDDEGKLVFSKGTP